MSLGARHLHVFSIIVTLGLAGCSSDDGGGAEPEDEICDNGVDDDGDADADCDDADCDASPACATTPEVCDDGSDNDGDGDADCDDADCDASPACAPAPEVCDDGLDNDGDGDADCDDADCAGRTACTADCASPVPVADPSTSTGSTTGHRDVSTGSCQAAGGGDVVFAVTPASGDIVEIILGSDANLGLHVQTTCGDTATELGCADQAAGAGAVERLVLTGVTPGQTLYVVVSGATASDAGAFNLTVESRAIECGDGRIDGDEECDDGNRDTDDGCDAECRAERVSEIEPNEDGTPEPGGAVQGNDFDSSSANGPFSQDVVISAAVAPVGDEDVFELRNPGAFATSVRLDIYSPALGIGVSCGDATDTQLHVRTADGAQLASNDNRATGDACSGLDIAIPAGASVYAHVLDFGDNAAIAAYLLRASFAACGDSVREGLEQCDDGNNDPDDGCSADCQLETTCGNDEIEPGEDCDDGNTLPGDGCSAECLLETSCGDGIPDPGEECDDGNRESGDGCNDVCRRETECGDGTIEPGEECEDGNAVPGDGCDSDCQVESVPESEPNDDGTRGNSGLGIAGDDFSAASADGPFASDTIVEAALSPAGDEDVFAITNTGELASSVRFDIYNTAVGLGQACGTTIDTGLNIRSAAGSLLRSNDNRASSADRCSGLDFIVSPGETVYAHVTDFGDNSSIPGYFLQIRFATCGDGVREGLEECDDGNNAPGDGCDASCASE
jgi:cysteine-rich repeat protein